MRVVRREEHGAEAVRVDHGARARRVGREAVAGPALVLAELAAAAVEARVAPPHVDAEDGAPRGPVEPVLRRPEPAERRAVGPREEGHRLRRPPEEAAVRVRGRGRGGEPLAGEPRGEAAGAGADERPRGEGGVVEDDVQEAREDVDVQKRGE